MLRRLVPATTNQRLAAAALILGALAVFARPMPGATVSVDARELAAIVQGEVDRVSPLELADWIVQERADYRLVDLRDATAYAQYHIPSADNVSIAELANGELARNERIVLYSDGDVRAAQAWFLLKAKGYRGVHLLDGGLDAWRDAVLFPVLSTDPTPFRAERNARLAAVARHFGGRPRSGEDATASSAPAAPVAMPTIAAPAGGGGAASGAKKKKKEGC